jgi:hypothetical protein
VVISIIMIIIISFFVLSFLIHKRITEPIDELSAAAEQVMEGNLEVEVSVLSPPRSVESYESLEIGRHGVILRKEGHQALFLPEVAVEQGWTRDDTLSQLARKAGLPENGWREGASFEVFTSTKYVAPYPLSEVSNPGGGQEAVESDGQVTTMRRQGD